MEKNEKINVEEMEKNEKINEEREKIKVLGIGSCGTVYLMRERHQYYALKSAKQPESNSLRLEEEILGHFNGCSNVIQCYGGSEGVEEDGGVVYNVVLEYASEGDLMEFVTDNYNGWKMPENEVKRVVRMILEGLLDVHNRGYIHCDLKPENILVFPDKNSDRRGVHVNYTLKIADFGLARRYGEKDSPKRSDYDFLGTPQYMSPESIRGEITGALDVWSLGCIVLQLFTGKPPWVNVNLPNLRDLLLDGHKPDIPDSMSANGKDFLNRCFVNDPKKRWTAERLLDHQFLRPDPDNM